MFIKVKVIPDVVKTVLLVTNSADLLTNIAKHGKTPTQMLTKHLKNTPSAVLPLKKHNYHLDPKVKCR